MSEVPQKAPEAKESDPKAKAKEMLGVFIKDGTISAEQRPKIEKFIKENEPWAASMHLDGVKKAKTLMDKVERNGWVTGENVKEMRDKIHKDYLEYKSVEPALEAVDICYEMMDEMEKNNWKDYPWRKGIKGDLKEAPGAAPNILNASVRPEYRKMQEAQRKKKDEAADKYLEENL